ncbi:MAG: hypothetical protein EBY09_15930, partial [Verrucomicrobia bacterium]|nr:hypothetical protein [Verrucomicrobiota bacterium]
CSPMVSCNTYGHYRRHTAGKVAAGTQLRLVKADGGAAGPLEAGEILVRGPQVMRGYWNNAAETALVLDETGWLRTGDIGVLDADGFMQIVDRIKDVIVVSGFNVYPKEIEDHALLHPDICEACAIASGDELAPPGRMSVNGALGFMLAGTNSSPSASVTNSSSMPRSEPNRYSPNVSPPINVTSTASTPATNHSQRRTCEVEFNASAAPARMKHNAELAFM